MEHIVPSRYLSVVPNVVSIGEALAIKGVFTKARLTLGDYQVAPLIELSTDRFGWVEVIVSVAESILLGERSVRIWVHDESVQKNLKVID